MSNQNNLQAVIDEENRRRSRGLLSDSYQLDCSRNPPSRPYLAEQDAEQTRLMREELNRQLALAGLPQAPIYERKPDNGNRARRTDKPAEVSANMNKPARQHSHYFKDVSKYLEADVYRVCQMFDIKDPSGATQHAVKKLLLAGGRGTKDKLKDLREASDTIQRLIEMTIEDAA